MKRREFISRSVVGASALVFGKGLLSLVKPSRKPGTIVLMNPEGYIFHYIDDGIKPLPKDWIVCDGRGLPRDFLESVYYAWRGHAPNFMGKL